MTDRDLVEGAVAAADAELFKATEQLKRAYRMCAEARRVRDELDRREYDDRRAAAHA